MSDDARDDATTPGTNDARTDSTAREPRQYRRGRWFRVENELMSALTRLGVIPRTYLLTTVGRKTGKERYNPVTLVKFGNERWLVAPYGAVPWVHNARAAGEVQITRRGYTRRFEVREVSAEEAAPVLKRYVAVASASRPYFHAERTAPVDAFVAEAPAHPVFELVAAGSAERQL
jgi:deazaflavin-dependent oxidoreductase (nitroreductase family)